MEAQTERLYKHLQHHKTITPIEAWELLGIYRLAAQIHKLRKIGKEIKTKSLTVRNRWGEACVVAKYVLESKPED